MDTRTKILSAASQLFLEGGASSLSVRAISKRAGLSTIGIYSHFQGKQGVLDALYIEGFDLVYESMDVETGEKVELNDVLTACKNYLQVAVKHEAHYRLIFGESGSAYEPSLEARAAAERAFGKLVHNTGAFLRDNGLRRDRFDASMDIWAIMHGYVSISHHARASDEWDWASMALTAVELQLRAIE